MRPVVCRMRNTVGLMGRIEIFVHGTQTGRLEQHIRTHNLIVNDGLAFFIDRVKGDTNLIANYGAVGISSTPAAGTQQTLLTEVFRTQLATSRRIGANQWQVKLFVASNQANGNTLREFGIFASPVAFDLPMIARVVHSDITKNTSVQVTYIWTGTLTAI